MALTALLCYDLINFNNIYFFCLFLVLTDWKYMFVLNSNKCDKLQKNTT